MIKDNLELKMIGTVTPARVPLMLEDRGASRDQPPSFGVYHDYKLEARIYATFSANKAMLDGQVRNARHHILENVYLDVRRRIFHLRMLVISGHTEQALKLIDEIDAATKAD